MECDDALQSGNIERIEAIYTEVSRKAYIFGYKPERKMK